MSFHICKNTNHQHNSCGNYCIHWINCGKSTTIDRTFDRRLRESTLNRITPYSQYARPPNMHFQYHFILSLLIVIQHNFTIFVNIIPSRSIYFKYYLVFHTFSTPSSSYTFSYTRILSHRQVPIRLESPTKSSSRRISALICKQGVPLFPEK